MMEFGNNIMCVDATHNTNMYDFYMITIVVVDGFGEGISVRWAISNRKEGCIYVTGLVKTSLMDQNIIWR